MKEQTRTWSAFAACALLLLGAMSFVTMRAVSLERLEARARADAHRQETLRLALWRMDSWMTALIAREAARPWFHYHSFFSADHPYSTIPGAPLETLQPDEPLAESPLLIERPEGVRLYFQVAGDKVTSPQTVDGGLRGLALLKDAKPAEMDRAQSDLNMICRDLQGTEFGKSIGLSEGDAAAAKEQVTNPTFRSYGQVDQAFGQPQPPSQVGQQSEQVELQKQNDYPQRQQLASSASTLNTNITQNRGNRRTEQPEEKSALKTADPDKLAAAPASGGPAPGAPADGKAKFDDKSAPSPTAPAAVADKPRDEVGKSAKSADAKLAASETRKYADKDLAKKAEREDAKSGEKGNAGKLEQGNNGVAAPATTGSPSYDIADKLKELQKVSPPSVRSVGVISNPVVNSPPQAEPSPLTVACTTVSAWNTKLQQPPATPAAPAASTTPPKPQPELFLTRHIASESEVVHQAIWLDWPALRTGLLGTIKDLSPDANLELVPQTTDTIEPSDASSRMASIPARLTLGQASDAAIFAAYAMPAWSPTRTGLLIGWAAILAALVAIGLVLRANILLSERRGRFVSAVTHELRTPLTTFTLYSQMLADGIITDEAARHEYHVTLKGEAQRLSRIVESVLDYAKLGTKSGGVQVTTIPATDLVSRVLPTLAARAGDGGMELVTSIPSLEGILIRGDHNSIERILQNLVDNAAKYAQSATDRRIHLMVELTGRCVSFLIADHGSGIADEDVSRIFSPFQRGKAQSSGTTPGLGLGLAFARNLAEDLGGELSLITREGYGAVFELRLKCVQPS